MPRKSIHGALGHLEGGQHSLYVVLIMVDDGWIDADERSQEVYVHYSFHLVPPPPPSRTLSGVWLFEQSFRSHDLWTDHGRHCIRIPPHKAPLTTRPAAHLSLLSSFLHLGHPQSNAIQPPPVPPPRRSEEPRRPTHSELPLVFHLSLQSSQDASLIQPTATST